MSKQPAMIIVAVLVIVAVVAIVAVAAGAFFILSPTATREVSGPDEVVVAVTVEQPVPPASEAPPPTADDQPQARGTSFEATTYRDQEAGFTFDYPASWTTGYSEGGSRGRTASLVAPDGNTLGVTVYLWEPVNDLDAWVDHRRRPWIDSGMTILSEQELTTADGHRVVQITVQTQTGEQALFALTTVGDRYLELGGAGDLHLLAEVVGTLRME